MMSDDPQRALLQRRHQRFGWWSLFVFVALGLFLEAMHGLKVGWYLDVGASTRRLMLTLSHAHGTLLGLVHLAFAGAVARLPGWTPRSLTFASHGMLGASVLLPLGFLLGGLVVYAGDPGLGVLLVPPGGVLLLVALFLTARAATRSR